MSKNYLEAFVIGLIAAAFGFFLTWPKYGDVEATSRKIEEKKAEIKSRQDYYDSLERISVQLESYSQEMEKIDSAFPNDPDSPSLMSFVQAAASQSGMVLKDIVYDGDVKGVKKPATAKTAGKSAETGKRVLQQYGVKATLAGSYQDYKNFLSRIEHSSRLIQVDEALVDAEKSDEDSSGKKVMPSDDNKKESASPIYEYEVIMSANYY